MLLKKVYIKNFRNIKEVSIDCEPLTVFIGENNVGKSNLLIALYKILKMDESPYRIRFNEDDFYFDESMGIRSNEIIIELTFDELTESDRDKFVSKGIDIINNQLNIQLQAVWEQENSDAKVSLNYIRKDDPDNELGPAVNRDEKKHIPFYYIGAYRDINRETIHSEGVLKQIFKDFNKYYLKPLNSQLSACSELIDSYIKEFGEKEDPKIIKILEQILPNLSMEVIEDIKPNRDDLDRISVEIKVQNEYALKKIILLLNNLLAKNAIQMKITDLQSLMNGLEGIENIKELLKKNLNLFVPEGQLNFEMGQIDESDLFNETNIDFGKISILKQGSGLQSSFVIALKLCKLLSHLQFSEEKITNLIIALEEPEAHMHPHLQRSLIKKIKIKQRELSELGLNVQFLITTHSPFILSQIEKNEICLLKRNAELSVTKFSSEFFQAISSEISERKLKHFDYIFRVYPEIFLSRGVIITEGKTEFGAIPEFAKKIEGFDLDDLGLTLICAESKDAIKPIYLTLKKFTKCAAIRDNEGTNSDENLISDISENYFKTNHKNFEEEITSSVDLLKLVKILIQVAPKEAADEYVSFLRKEIKELQKMEIEEILSKWDLIDFSLVKIDRVRVIQTLKQHCKTALTGSLIAEKMSREEIPECYEKFLFASREMVTN
jgi:putative ATP-dependent endonuclease of the OLD family